MEAIDDLNNILYMWLGLTVHDDIAVARPDMYLAN